MRVVVLFIYIISFSIYGNEKIPINTPLEVIDLKTGLTQVIPGANGYSYQLNRRENQTVDLHIFTETGEKIEGSFVLGIASVKNDDGKRLIESYLDILEEVKNINTAHESRCYSEASPKTSPCQIPGMSEKWKSNCSQLYSSGIPSKALDYALNVMLLNNGSFRTNMCFNEHKQFHESHPLMAGLKNNEIKDKLFSNGLSNKCQLMINNFDEKKDICQSASYYIDLCKENRAIIIKSDIKLGRGTCLMGRGFSNEPSNETSLLGAFFTHNQIFPTLSLNTKEYASTLDKVKKSSEMEIVPATALFGLQRSNNRSIQDKKYLSVSPYRMSRGGVAIAPENSFIIKELAENGPSLLLNYSEGEMDKLEECTE